MPTDTRPLNKPPIRLPNPPSTDDAYAIPPRKGPLPSSTLAHREWFLQTASEESNPTRASKFRQFWPGFSRLKAKRGIAPPRKSCVPGPPLALVRIIPKTPCDTLGGRFGRFDPLFSGDEDGLFIQAHVSPRFFGCGRGTQFRPDSSAVEDGFWSDGFFVGRRTKNAVPTTAVAVSHGCFGPLFI